jgi:ribonuclease H-related protein
MLKTKYYAIKLGNRKLIVDQWTDCEWRVKGVSGAEYKAFKSKEAAQDWLGLVQTSTELQLKDPAPEIDVTIQIKDSPNISLDSIPRTAIIQAYVDGSFQPKISNYAGWGVALIYEDQLIQTLNGKTRGPALSRNIDGELRASLEAMKWANHHNREIHVFHDYEGIARWARGEWKAKSEIAKMYVQASKNWSHLVEFIKVSAHSGDKWNDLADDLAKKGLKE